MEITILGGGLAGISLACFLQDHEKVHRVDIIEKTTRLGGLCRSCNFEGVFHDVGPHIIFSKDQEILDHVIRILDDNVTKLKRSNKIIHAGRWVHFPFENDLGSLPDTDRDYCLDTFLHNPHATDRDARNLLEFFLKTFGEGITSVFLKPYNEKIWKHDPALMGLQMMERIPNPPPEDVIKGAKGDREEGYVHQLHFWYPAAGGIESLIKAMVNTFNEKVHVHLDQEVTGIDRTGQGSFVVRTRDASFTTTRLVSTIPVGDLVSMYAPARETKIPEHARELKHNSIIITAISVKPDMVGDNFAFMTADQDVLFHRISKLDFLGPSYRKHGVVTYLAETTYRDDDAIATLDDATIREKVIQGMEKLHFITGKEDVIACESRRVEHAYVIYDLDHSKHMAAIRDFFAKEGIMLHGRFGEHEYYNMDAVIRRSKDRAQAMVSV